MNPHRLNMCLHTQISWFLTCTFWSKHGVWRCIGAATVVGLKHALIAYEYIIRGLRPRTCICLVFKLCWCRRGIFSLLCSKWPIKGWRERGRGVKHLDFQQVGWGVQNRNYSWSPCERQCRVLLKALARIVSWGVQVVISECTLCN